METPAGREWLTSQGTGKNWNWQQIQNWMGLRLEDIDYMVAGVKLDNNLIPRLILIVESIRPFEISKVRDQLKASKWPDSDAVEFPSNHTLVMALNKKDLQLIPKEGFPRADQFITSVQNALRERIGSGSHVWVVGSIEDWERTVAATFLAAWPKENREVVKKIQTFVISINFDKPPVVQMAIQCGDEKAAKSLLELLIRQNPNQQNDWKINQMETWVSFQANATNPAMVLDKVKIAIPGKNR
jgi:hypothetical protein